MLLQSSQLRIIPGSQHHLLLASNAINGPHAANVRNGEFVVVAAAAAAYGLQLGLQAINVRALLPFFKCSIQHPHTVRISNSCHILSSERTQDSPPPPWPVTTATSSSRHLRWASFAQDPLRPGTSTPASAATSRFSIRRL